MTPLAGFQFGCAHKCLGVSADFQVKRILAIAAAGVLFAAASASAQQYPLRLPQGTSAQPQRVTSPPPRAETPDVRYPANPLYPGDALFTPYPVAVTYIPAVLMSDGTVWANFGYGYVQVRSACRPARVFDSRGLASARRRDRVETPCYTRNAHGSLVVTR